MSRRVDKKVFTYNAGSWILASDSLFLYDGWNMICESSVTGQQSPVVKSYIWGLDLSQTLQSAGGIGGLIASIDTSTNKMYYYLYDANGNVGQLINATDGSLTAHYEYDPYGNITVKTGTYADQNPYRFSSKYFDQETGLLYYGYRYYDSRLGRWISRDPSEEKGGINLYVFVNNDSINAFDVFGLWTRNTWSGIPWSSYSGEATAESCDTLSELAYLITGYVSDWTLLGISDRVQVGQTVDISPLLKKLEMRMRNNVVSATSLLHADFPSAGQSYCNGSNVASSTLDNWFNSNSNPVPVCDCLGAAVLIFAKGLDKTLKPGEFEALYGNTNDIPFVDNSNITLSNMKVGDWGYFKNDQGYLFYHPSGGYQGENVIKVGANNYWGFPGGNKSSQEWQQELIDAYNSGLPSRSHISTIPGFSGDVTFLNVPIIGMKVFDYRKRNRHP